MTISSTNRRAGPYSGNGSQTAFPFSFKVFQASDMLVVKVQVSTNIETTLTLTTDYTVALNADQNSNAGGNINLVTALPSGYKMVISSKVEYLQETDLTNQGGFYPEVITNALDRLTIEAQQLKEGLDRAAQLPITSSSDAAALVADIVRIADSADNLDTVATNIDEVNAVAGDIAGVSTVAGIAGNVTTVAGIASNVTTVAGISTNVTTVAGISTDVETVSANNANVTTVATNIADVNTVAADIADINTCADNMAAILDAPAQASAAAASAAAAAASLDNFDDRYLGSKATAPTVDNDGNALVAGALYFNNGTVVSDDKGMWVYDGGTWIAASAASQAILVRYKYVATAAQTTFTDTDANGLTLSYTAGSIIVTLNGVVMDAADYTATTGNSVVLASGAAASDEVCVFAFSTFDIANTYTQAQADAEFLRKAGEDGVTVSGGNVGIGITSPSGKLDLAGGSGTAQTAIRIRSLSTNSNGFNIVTNSSTDDIYLNNYYGSAMLFGTNNTERMRIDSSGRVTTPYQPAFWAQRTAGNVTGPIVIVFNNAALNKGSHYNAITGRFTCPVAGTYQFHVSLMTNGGSNRVQADIRVNGSGRTVMEMTAGYNFQQGGMTLMLDLNASDYVEVGLSATVDAIYGSGYNSFSGSLVG